LKVGGQDFVGQHFVGGQGLKIKKENFISQQRPFYLISNSLYNKRRLFLVYQ
jgi:hypothetical protein